MANQFNYFYKKFDTIRAVLRRIYIYGCYNRDDFKAIVSPRKFDNELKRIHLVLNQDDVVSTYKGKSKYTMVNYDYFTKSDNVLIGSYYAKAFKESEFKVYFIAMQLLNENPDGLTLSEIESKGADYLCNIDRATLRNALDKMEDEGYLAVQKVANKKKYKLASDVLADLTDEELSELKTAVEFYKNITPIKSIGYFAADTLNECAGQKDRPHFIFRHNYLHLVLDDEVKYLLLKAINQSSIVSFVYKGTTKLSVSPISLTIDERFGREYLLGWDTAKGGVALYRIDKIENVSITKDSLSLCGEFLSNSWCVSGIGCSPKHIAISFKFDPGRELHLIKKLKCECKHGNITDHDGSCLLEITVTDPLEMVPWLRLFYGYIIDISDPELKEYIKADIGKVVSVFETV